MKTNTRSFLIEVGCTPDEIERIKTICQMFNAQEIKVMELPLETPEEANV